MKLRHQAGVCRGSVSGPMMGDLRVALKTCPSGVASFGRVTHAPADSTLYRAMLRGQQLHPWGTWDRWSWEYPPSIQGGGGRRWVELFKVVEAGGRVQQRLWS